MKVEERSLLAVASACLPLAALLIAAILLGAPSQAGAAAIDPRVEAAAREAGPDGTVSVLLHLTDRAPIAELNAQLKARHATRGDRHETVVRALQEAAARSQGPVLALLEEGRGEGLVVGFTPYWITNVVVAQLRPAFLERLAVRADIEAVEPSIMPELIHPVTNGHWHHDPEQRPVVFHGRQVGVPPGIRAINADRCWYELGLTGAGRLICGQDTGVDGTHIALETSWRGYGGADPPEECWFDCLADSVGTPYDTGNHGTHTMGTMCGIDPVNGDSIGVAFGAQWIACNSIGQAGWNEEFDNDVIACFQWIADPDGDPGSVDDVPDVCQNSWGGYEYPQENSWYHRCDDLWWEAIDNCEAAGVVVTFSAGNESHPMTLRIPPDRNSTPWNTYAVGAIDATNYEFPYPRASFSSQGPSGCDEITIKPEVSAPGVDVVSSVPGDDYAPMSGTSMAGPHVAGVVALLREIDPDLESDRVKQILMDTAVDHGDAGEDNAFGWGVIDAYAACLAVMHGYGSLTGQVVELEDRAPLTGACVAVPDLGRASMTDADGNYDLRHLAAGTWQVVTELFGYDPDTCEVVIADEGQHVQDIALLSHPRGQLRGFVLGDGTRLEDVVMQILDAPVADDLTAADGSYGFADLPVGSYTLAAGRFGRLPQHRIVEITAGDSTQADFNLLRGCLDDFEIDQGWIIGAPDDDATEGIWERDDPNRTLFGSDEVQPSDDHTPDGVACYITHNQPEDSPRFYGDVDGGKTTLRSPIFDVTAAQMPVLTYWRWHHSTSGWPIGLEFRCDVSDDGGASWVNVDTYIEGDGGWDQVLVPLNQPGITPSDQMQIRFVTEDDAHAAATVESAVDDVEVLGFPSSAERHEQPLVLHLRSPRPNPLGQGTILSFTLPYAQSVELGIYDTAGRLVRELASGKQEAGLHRLFWDGRNGGGRRVHSGVYFVHLATDNQTLSRKLVITR